MSRWLKLGSICLLITLLMSACVTAAPVAPPTEVAPAAEPAATDASAAEPAATEVPSAAEAPAVEPGPGEVREVPRNRTFISTGWDFYNQVPNPDNFNPYLGVHLHSRNSLHYTVYESLFYSNYASGETVPWLGQSWEYNDDFTVLTVNLHPDAVWSDGEPFTADDVVFTINMLKDHAPELIMSAEMNEWVQDVTAVDDATVQITLSKPGPRWAVDYLATGQSNRFIVMPEHIWANEDPMTFNNFDIAKGWPVGTGPYTLVSSGADQVLFDLRDSWWAADAGVAERMPAVERIVYVPATVEAMPQLFANADIEVGRALQLGNFEAAKAQNPDLISWNKEGPVWGAPDGCVYRLTVNNQRPPFDNPQLRWAINHAINREQFVQLGYEGSTRTAVAPLSSYGGVQQYVTPLADLFEQYKVDDPDPAKTATIMTELGYAKNSDGFWADANGETLKLNIEMEVANPSGPVLVQQLKDAGFDAIATPTQQAAFVDHAVSGEFDLHLWVHCGSTYDPWLTLDHYHSKYVPEPGQPVGNVRTYQRYSNPELDALLDQMEAMVPSPDDPAYMDLVRQAIEIYLRDLPDITLAEEMHVVTMNSRYWTNWPSPENPYMHPYLPWEGFNIIIHHLEPTQ